jgi:hypothetical protein
MEDEKSKEKVKSKEAQAVGMMKQLGIYINQYANFVDAMFADIFAKIGMFVGTRPWSSIGLSLVVLLLTCIGFMNFYSESRSDKLWVPQNTQGQADQDIFDSYFQGARVEYVLIEAKQADSMLTKDLLEDVMTIYEQVHALSVVVEGETETLSTLCMKDYSNGDPCLIQSVLENWSYNASILGSEVDDTSILTTLNAANEPADLKNVLGDIQTSSGDLTSAEAAIVFFFIEDNKETVNGEYVDEKADDWYKIILLWLSFHS